jgi:hypothetical protein
VGEGNLEGVTRPEFVQLAVQFRRGGHLTTAVERL